MVLTVATNDGLSGVTYTNYEPQALAPIKYSKKLSNEA